MVDEEKKKLLILGCGYLGIRLARAAVDLGYHVKAVSRNADSLAEVSHLGVETFCGLVNDTAWHGFAGDSVDFVVNCVSSAGGGLSGYEESYVDGNRSLVEWINSIGFSGTAVFTSSVGVYPDAGGAVVRESNEIVSATKRGKLMLEAERVFRKMPDACRWFVFRLAGLYGPGRHLMLDTVRGNSGELPGFGDYYLNLVRIEDVVGAVLGCFESVHSGGTFNVVDDESTVKSKIVEWLAERLGVVVPSFSGVTGVGSRRFAEGMRPANRRISNCRIRDELGWVPSFPSFREGFEDLI